MKRSLLFVALSAVALGVMGGAARVAVSSGQSGALVRLQPGFPGVVQSGNINVSGYIRGGQVNTYGPNVNIEAYSTESTAIRATSASETNPAIRGIVGGYNWGVVGQNDVTGAYGVLGAGASGILASAGTGGLAAELYGNVYLVGKLSLNTYSNAFPVSIDKDSNNNFLGLGSGGVAKWVVSAYPDGNSLDIGEESVTRARMHFSPGGKVGINNVAPAHALDVRGAIVSDSFLRVNSTGYGFLQEAGGKGVGFYLDANTGYVGSLANTPLNLFSGSVIYATLTQTGRFGLGSFNPNAKLEVIGTGGLTPIAAFGSGVDGIYTSTTGVNGNGLTADASSGASARGVWGRATSGYGVVGQGPVYGVYAGGNLGASGSKTFRIDHPQDPLNKYLLHYSAEGPEPQNIYNGTITTDEQGHAWVELPSYYNDINRDPRIQLTVDDESEDFVMVKAVGGIKGSGFRIRTSRGNTKVYWEVKAVRNDAYVQKYGAPVELNKTEPEKGKYQHPELYGAPAEMGMYYSPVEGTKAAQRKEPAALPPIK